jgi:hypothetical protein
MKRYFDNTVKKDSAPKWYTGKLLFEMVKNIQVVFGKVSEPNSPSTNLTIELNHRAYSVKDTTVISLIQQDHAFKRMTLSDVVGRFINH